MKCMMSADNSVLLPMNVDRLPPSFSVFVALYNRSLDDWPLGKPVNFISLELRFLGNKIIINVSFKTSH